MLLQRVSPACREPRPTRGARRPPDRPAPKVIRLCERHRLHTASVYVLTRINDFRKPLVDLLGATAAAAASGDARGARALALKLMVLVRGAFRGRAYPPGTGVMAG